MTKENSMGTFVIASYRPKPGKDAQLLEVLRDHLPILRQQQLVTDRPAYFMKAQDGAIVEVFEWKSQQAIDEAHKNPAVLALWRRFEACCEYGGLRDLKELAGPFPNFEALEL